MKFSDFLTEASVIDWMKIIRAKHGKDVKFEKAELDCTVAIKDGKCVGTFDKRAGKEVTEDAKPRIKQLIPSHAKHLLQRFERWSDGMHPSEMSAADIEEFADETQISRSEYHWLLALQRGDLKEDATTDKWRARMYELRALQKERTLTKKELDELLHLEDLVVHDRREVDEEAEQQFVIMANVSGGVTGNRTAPVRQGGKLLKFNNEKEAQDHAAHLTKTANRQPSVAQFKYWAAPYRDYLHQEAVTEAAGELKTNFIPSLEIALRKAVKADSVNIAPFGKNAKDTYSVNVIFSKPVGNLDDNKIWSAARKHAGRDVTVTFNSPRKFGSGVAYLGKLVFQKPLKEADEVRFSSGKKMGLDKWLDTLSGSDKKKPAKKYQNKPWPKMKVPGVVVSASHQLRDRLAKAVKELGIDIEHQGYSGGSTLWTVGFIPKKGFNIEKFEDELRDKLNFDGWLEVEFEDFDEA